MMTKEEKEGLKGKLPPKWSITIARKTGLSTAYVRRVMSGLATHMEIEKNALELAIESQEQAAEVERLKAKVL